MSMNNVHEVISAEIVESNGLVNAVKTTISDSDTILLLDGDDIETKSNHNCEAMNITPAPMVPLDKIIEVSEDIEMLERKIPRPESAAVLNIDDIDIKYNPEAMNMTPVHSAVDEIMESSEELNVPENVVSDSDPILIIHGDKSGVNHNPDTMSMTLVPVMANDEIIESSEVKDILKANVSDAGLTTVLDRNFEITYNSAAANIATVPVIAIDKEKTVSFVSTGDSSIDIETDLHQQYGKLRDDNLPEDLLLSSPVEEKSGDDEKIKTDVTLDKRNRRKLSAPVNLFAAALKGASGMSRRERALKSPSSKLTGTEVEINSVASNDNLNRFDCDKSSEMDNSLICPDSSIDAMTVQSVSSGVVNDISPQPVGSNILDTRFRNVILSEPVTTIIEDDSNTEGTLDDLGSDLSTVQFKDSNHDSTSIQSNNSKDSGYNQKRDDMSIKDDYTQPKGRGSFTNSNSNINFHSDVILEMGFVNTKKTNTSRYSNTNSVQDNNYVSKQSNISHDIRVKKNFDSTQPSSNHHIKPQDIKNRSELDNHQLREHDNKGARSGNNITTPYGVFKDATDSTSHNNDKKNDHNISNNKDDVNGIKKNVINYGDFPTSNDSNKSSNFYAKNNDDIHKRNSNLNRNIPDDNDRRNHGFKTDNKYKQQQPQQPRQQQQPQQQQQPHQPRQQQQQQPQPQQPQQPRQQPQQQQQRQQQQDNHAVNNNRLTTNDNNTFNMKNPTNKSVRPSGPPKYQQLPNKNDVSIQEKLRIHLNQNKHVSNNYNDSNGHRTANNDNLSSKIKFDNDDHVMSKNDHKMPNNSHGMIKNDSNYSSNDSKGKKNDNDSNNRDSDNKYNDNKYNDNNDNHNSIRYNTTKATQPSSNSHRSCSNESNESSVNKNSTFESILKTNIISKKKNPSRINDDLMQKKLSIEETLKSAFANKQSKSWADDNSDDD